MRTIVLFGFLFLVLSVVQATSLDDEVRDALSTAESTLASTNAKSLDGADSDSMEPDGTSWVNEMRKTLDRHDHHSWATVHHTAMLHRHLKRHKYIASLLTKMHQMRHQMVAHHVAHQRIMKRWQWRQLQEEALRYLVRVLRNISDHTRGIYHTMRRDWTLHRPKHWLHQLFWSAGKYMKKKLELVTRSVAHIKGRAGQYLQGKLDELAGHLRREFNDAEDADADAHQAEVLEDEDEEGDTEKDKEEDGHSWAQYHEKMKGWKMRMDALRMAMKNEFDSVHDNLRRMFRFMQSRIAYREKKIKEGHEEAQAHHLKRIHQAQRVKALFKSIGTYIHNLYQRINRKEKERQMKLEAAQREEAEKKRQETWAEKMKKWEEVKAERERLWSEVAARQDKQWETKLKEQKQSSLLNSVKQLSKKQKLEQMQKYIDDSVRKLKEASDKLATRKEDLHKMQDDIMWKHFAEELAQQMPNGQPVTELHLHPTNVINNALPTPTPHVDVVHHDYHIDADGDLHHEVQVNHVSSGGANSHEEYTNVEIPSLPSWLSHLTGDGQQEIVLE